MISEKTKDEIDRKVAILKTSREKQEAISNAEVFNACESLKQMVIDIANNFGSALELLEGKGIWVHFSKGVSLYVSYVVANKNHLIRCYLPSRCDLPSPNKEHYGIHADYDWDSKTVSALYGCDAVEVFNKVKPLYNSELVGKEISKALDQAMIADGLMIEECETEE